LNDFFTARECDDYIIWSEQKGYEEAKVLIDGKQVMMNNIRNNSPITYIDEHLADRIWEKIQPFIVGRFESMIAIVDSI
jgi:hypothetical protein